MLTILETTVPMPVVPVEQPADKQVTYTCQAHVLVETGSPHGDEKALGWSFLLLLLQLVAARQSYTAIT